MAFSETSQKEGESNLKFEDDASDSSKEENKSANNDSDKTPRNESATGTESSLIDSSYEMDEDGELIKKMPAKGTSLEMTDLRYKKSNPPTTIRKEFVMKQFEPEGKVNQSKKKREKRKMQKEKQEELERVLAEQKRKEQEAKAKAEYLAAKAKGLDVKNPTGKVLKKKVIPKKKIADERGDWEVVDQKKSVLVEEDDNKEDSDLSFE